MANATPLRATVISYPLLITYYLLLITHYLLLITYYSLLITHYLLLITYYSLLITYYLLLITNYQLPITHYQFTKLKESQLLFCTPSLEQFLYLNFLLMLKCDRVYFEDQIH